MQFFERAMYGLATPSQNRHDACLLIIVFTAVALLGWFFGLVPVHYIFVPTIAIGAYFFVRNELDIRRC